MQLSVSGQHLTITETLHSHITARLEKITQHFDHMTNMHVVLHVEKNRHVAEVTINIKGGQLHARGSAEDMYAAIDAMAVKLDRQVIRHKEKLTDRQRHAQ